MYPVRLRSRMLRGLGQTSYSSGEEVPIEQQPAVDAIMEERAAKGLAVTDVAFRTPDGQIVNVQYSKTLKPAFTIAGISVTTIALVAGVGLLAYMMLGNRR